ncbi:hypothetical protein [Clostridium akagii]|uniref:hypothetical protein n=1 Tax=Clostridium akagii TaxID=91623 RepID=UPI00056D8659|nr:hypothetical protein [Clostridium akagii]
MQEQGWIKIFRILLDKPIWLQSTPEQKTILITLLLMANHKDKEWEWKDKKFKAKPGQFITSLNSIVKKCGKGISIQNVRTALDRFKKYEFLTYESTKTGRLITIVNWGLYQELKDNANKGINKGVTNNQQSTNKELTTNKNDKNVKNDKKYNYMSDSNEYRLATYLFNYIRNNNPNAKEPNFQNWSRHFDYILRIDKRDIEEVKAVIKWCQHDSFWYKNILSPDKLRKQYDRLLIETNNPKNNNKVVDNSAIDEF